MKNAHGRTCKKTKVHIYLYISLYENLFENGRVYIYYRYILLAFFYALPITGLILIACVSDNKIATSAIALAFTDNSLVNEQ